MTVTTASIRRTGPAALCIEGDFDTLGAPGLRSDIDRAIAEATDELVVDLSAVRYLSSAGLRVLVYTRECLPDRTRLVLRADNEVVLRSLRMVGFHSTSHIGTAQTVVSAV